MHATTLTRTIAVRTRELKELPPLPGNVRRVLAALSNPDIAITQFAAIVEESPALTARVVGLARAAYFGTAGTRVHSVSDAIIKVLGLPLVKNLATGIALTGSFDAGACRGFDARRYWESALLNGGFGRLLARSAALGEGLNPDTAYLCGILHNIGLVALVHLAPEAMNVVFTEAAARPEQRLSDVEEEQIGTAHDEIGALVMRRWNVPPEVALSMEHHDDPRYRGEGWAYALLIHLTGRWSKQHLAGVANPWLEESHVRALGIEETALQEVMEQAGHLGDEVRALADLMAGAH